VAFAEAVIVFPELVKTPAMASLVLLPSTFLENGQQSVVFLFKRNMPLLVKQNSRAVLFVFSMRLSVQNLGIILKSLFF
jgi:hypothetical protein